MTRQDKCISLPLAKQIAVEHERLGIVVESEWWWTRVANVVPECWQLWQHNHGEVFKRIPAYDTSELGVMLKGRQWRQFFGFEMWHIVYRIDDKHEEFIGNEPSARGKMYLWLLKEGI